MKKGKNNAQKVYPGTPLAQKIGGLRRIGFDFKSIEELIGREVTFMTCNNFCKKEMIEVV